MQEPEKNLINRLKKNSYKENDKKNSHVRKFPTTHNFSYGPSLRTGFPYNTGV